MQHYLHNLWKISRQLLSGDSSCPLPDATTRRHIRRLVDGLAYDFTHYTLLGLIDFLNLRLPRPIQLIHFPTPFPHPIGLWYHTPAIEFVVIPEGPQFHPLLQEHIALHEIAHILLGHPPVPLAHFNVLAAFQSTSPDVPPIGRALHFKQNYLLQPPELEAEYLATLIQQRGLPRHLRYSLTGRASSIAGLSPLANDLAFDEES